MKHEGYNLQVGNPSYNYEYSGKELQKETGWSDFGARMYMSDIGRWGVIDPLAETTTRVNPYNFALNNPVMFVDPDGRKAYDPEALTVDYARGGALDFYMSGGFSTFGSFEDFLATDGSPYRGFKGAYGGKNEDRTSKKDSKNPTFQFPKGQEEYYKKNYPAFYDFVMNDLPKMVADTKFMEVLSTLSGFSIEELTKMFKSDTNYGLIAHNTIGFSNADYPHGDDKSYPINLIRINNEVLDWFQSANRDTKTFEGIKNLFYMTTLIGHEVNHWGEATGGRVPFSKTGLGPMGYNDAGDYFENKLLNDTYYKRGIGNAGSFSPGIDAYVKKNFNVLYNIFNKK